MKRVLLSASLALANALLANPAYAGGACCAAGASYTSLIANDDETQFVFSLSGSATVGSSSSNGDVEFYHDEMHDRSLTGNLSAAFRLPQDFQIGFSVPIKYRDVKNLSRESNSSGISDISGSLSYRIIRGNSYEAFAPHFLVSVTGVVPTGESDYESENPNLASGLGAGFWSVQASLLALQNWSSWDLSAQPYVKYVFKESFDGPQGSIDVDGKFALGGQVRAGYNFGNSGIRFGLGFGPQWQEASTETTRFGSNKIAHKLVWDSIAELSYTHSHSRTISLSYTDQSLIGPTNNTPITRTLAVSYRVGWF